MVLPANSQSAPKLLVVGQNTHKATHGKLRKCKAPEQGKETRGATSDFAPNTNTPFPCSLFVC